MTEQLSDVELAKAIALRAGRLLLQHRTEFGPVAPGDRARLSELRDQADRASHELIVAALAQARPGDAVLSEEGTDDAARLTAARVWIVDPLDGTWEYGQGRADFGVHIALWLAPDGAAPGRLSATAVDLSAVGTVRTSADPDPKLPALAADRPLRIVVSRTRAPAGIERIAARWRELTGRAVEIVSVGSVGAKVEEILSGRAEGYLHDTGFREWDIAAPMGVAHHYGLVVEHWDATAIRLNQMPPWVPNVLVTRPELADSLRRAVRG